MITILGGIIVVLAIFLVIRSGIDKYNFNKQEQKAMREAKQYGETYTPSTYNPGFLFSKAFIGIVFALGIGVSVLGAFNPFYINDAGNRQVIQPLSGELDVRFAPGLYYAGIGSKVTTWPNNFTIQVSREEHRTEEADLWVPSNRDDGTFSEGDNAELEHTVKWDLPNDKANMIDLHTTYNNVDNLMQTTLLSYQKKIASFSTQRMSSEGHYSGGKSLLDEYFQDQLRNGQVILETQTKTRVLEDSTKETYIDVKPKLDSLGKLVRTESDIQKFKIISTYTSMDNVYYSPEIKEKLKKKIEFAANKANSKQELIAAQQEEQTAIVKGRKLIAETTAREEAAEKEAVIRARKERLVAQENVLRDKAKAESTLALKRAEAEGDKLKVLAGLSPLERARIDKETSIGVAAELAKVKFPNEMIIVGGGNDGQGGVNPFAAVGLQSFYELSKKMSDNSSKK